MRVCAENTSPANVRADGLPASTPTDLCPDCGLPLGRLRDGPNDRCPRCRHPTQRTRERRNRARHRAYLAALAVWEGEGGLLPPANPKLTLKERGLKACTVCGAELPLGWFRLAGHGRRRGRCRLCERPAKSQEHAVRRQRLYHGRALPVKVPLDIIARLMLRQRNLCACGCGQSVLFNYHLDHRISIKRGGLHTESNLQLLTPKCNLKKGSGS